MYNIYKVETIGDVSGAPARATHATGAVYGSLSQARDFGRKTPRYPMHLTTVPAVACHSLTVGGYQLLSQAVTGSHPSGGSTRARIRGALPSDGSMDLRTDSGAAGGRAMTHPGLHGGRGASVQRREEQRGGGRDIVTTVVHHVVVEWLVSKETTSCDALLSPTKRHVDTEPLFDGRSTCVCTPLALKCNAVQLKRYSTLQTTKGSANKRGALRSVAPSTTADRPQALSAPPPLCRLPRSNFSLLSRWRGVSTSSRRRCPAPSRGTASRGCRSASASTLALSTRALWCAPAARVDIDQPSADAVRRRLARWQSGTR
eukprot:2759078-Pyramimonas_sp.AAC.2